MRRFSNTALSRAARWVMMAAVAVSALIFIAGCGSSGGVTAGTSGHITAAEPAASRQPAPAFSGKTMDGVAVSSEGFKGKPTVLAFWASW
jgi:cytochrome oxidase Cu insertion factor (SCO1/SenC/PrrC family)